jgi:Zn-finger protein
MDARWNQDKTEGSMVIDCDDCVMQHTNACDDCVVTALLHITDHPVRLVKAESEALGNLAEVGLVAPLRLVPAVERGVEVERSA